MMQNLSKNVSVPSKVCVYCYDNVYIAQLIDVEGKQPVFQTLHH
jgi:hypothetical protein